MLKLHRRTATALRPPSSREPQTLVVHEDEFQYEDMAARDLGPALDFAEEAKKLAKPALVTQLDALASSIATEGRDSARAGDDRADAAWARYALALSAIRDIEGNAAPQLAMEAMLIRMRGV